MVDAEIEGEVAAFGINGQFMKTMLDSFKTEIIVMHPDAHHRRVMFLAEGEPDLIGVIGMMNITTELAEGPKHDSRRRDRVARRTVTMPERVGRM